MTDREELAAVIYNADALSGELNWRRTRELKHPSIGTSYRIDSTLAKADAALEWVTARDVRRDAEVAAKALEDAQEALVLKDAFTERSLRIMDELIAALRASFLGAENPETSEFGPDECDGSGCCPASRHVHGCYTPHRATQCDEPDGHGHIPESVGSGGGS